MKLRIKNRNIIPHGGAWRYKDPNSGATISAVTYENLISLIRAHRIANHFPMGLEFEEEVERQLCSNHPDECEEHDPRIPRKRRLTLSDVINGSKAMVSFVANGSKVVPREEAERRAQICLKCPYHVEFDKPCSGICQELRNVVNAIINQAGTKYDKDLKSCAVCGCYVQAAIQLQLSDQCNGVTESQKEQFRFVRENHNCWKDCDNL